MRTITSIALALALALTILLYPFPATLRTPDRVAKPVSSQPDVPSAGAVTSRPNIPTRPDIPSQPDAPSQPHNPSQPHVPSQQDVPSQPHIPSEPHRAHWPGWDGIKHMVVFGDSMTSTRFNFRKEQPSEINPLGNPEYPGNTSSIGPNWVGYLTTTYNSTFLKTLNLADGGATVDGDIVEQIYGSIKSFKRQIEEWWFRHYVPPRSAFNWKKNDTLFAAYFGSNDVSRAYLKSWNAALEADINEYGALLDVLYQRGARNFLVLNILPFERSPMLEGSDAKAKKELGEMVTGWNGNITRMVSQFRDTHSEATVFLFDTYDLFHQILDDPCSYEPTCSLQVTSTYCEAYMYEQEDQYLFDSGCRYPVNQYFWLNSMHPSWKVHDATAQAIAALLSDTT